MAYILVGLNKVTTVPYSPDTLISPDEPLGLLLSHKDDFTNF